MKMRNLNRNIDDMQPRPIFVGGMYADREPGNVKVTRVKTTPIEPFVARLGKQVKTTPTEPFVTRLGKRVKTTPIEPFVARLGKRVKTTPIEPFVARLGTRVETTPIEPFVAHHGKVTCKLVDLDESLSDRETVEEEEELDDDVLELPAIHNRERTSRNVVIFDPLSQRLNGSIEISDDECNEKLQRTINQKLPNRVINNKLKRPLKSTLKVTSHEPIIVEEVPCKKKSVIVIAPQSKSVIKLAPKQNAQGPAVSKRKKVTAKRNIATLQSDFLTEDIRTNVKKDLSPKWKHDRFKEVIVDSEKQVSEKCNGKSIKSRLGALNLSNDDSDVSTDSVKVNLCRRKIIAEKNKTIQKTKPHNAIRNPVKSDRVKTKIVELSDSEGWTEGVRNSAPPSKLSKKSVPSKACDREVSRVPVKSSIHEKVDKIIKRVATSRGQPKKVDTRHETRHAGRSKTVDTKHETRDTTRNRASSREGRSRKSTKDKLDSSFTDSSGDERYKKRVDTLRKRNERFCNDRHRSRHR